MSAVLFNSSVVYGAIVRVTITHGYFMYIAEAT